MRTSTTETNDALHAVAVVGDPAACLEPASLIPSRPGRRPADLLTVAASVDGGCVALDVGIASPHAAEAGEVPGPMWRRNVVGPV